MLFVKKEGRWNSFKNWFIGDYLEKTEDYLIQTRIRLMFFVLIGTTSVVAIINVLLLINGVYVSFFLSLIALFSFAFSLYILKVKQNVHLASVILIIMTFCILTTILFFENILISVFNILNLFASCMFTFFILGKRWGVIYSVGISIVIAFYIHFFMYENFHNESAFMTSKLWIIYAVVLIALSITLFVLITFLNVRDNIQLKFEEKNKELLHVNLIAEQAVKTQELFIANTSHEIRTPMNAIVGYSELLKKENLNHTQQEYIEIIRTASYNLLNIINDILDYSKMSAGNITIDETYINLKTTIKNVIVLLQFQADSKNIELNFKISEEIPEYILCDNKRINQILINLISNAIKFTKQGSVQLIVDCQLINQEICDITFEVKDTGIGIPDDKKNVIFEKFVQLDSTITRENGGTGLGLAISSDLVKLLGGKLLLESKINEGSRFYFTLQRHYKENSTMVMETELFEIEDIENVKILLVDDNFVNRKLAVDSVKKWNSKILIDTANDGYDALSCLSKNNYDIILMDLHMPKMDGYETTKHIREILKSDIKIVALTASVLSDGREKCLSVGMNDFVLKPFEMNHLMKVIAEQLSLNIVKVETAPLSVEFDPFSIEPLFNLLNNQDSVKETLIEMSEEVGQSFISLKAALLERNWLNVFKLVHSIKNNALYFGSNSFIKELGNIEKKADLNAEKFQFEIDIEQVTKNWELINKDILVYITK